MHQLSHQLNVMQEKNVESDMLEGKVGRIYMPKQSIDTIPQHKMKVMLEDPISLILFLAESFTKLLCWSTIES